MADIDEKAFRDAVLAGAGRTDRDTPGIRVAAAVDHFKGQVVAAAAAEDSAAAAVTKAHQHVQAAQEAVVAAQAQRERAEAELAAARRLLEDVQSGRDISAHLGSAVAEPGQDVTIHPGVATATGEGSF